MSNIFKTIDHDGNGKIDFEEFVDIMRLQKRHDAWLLKVQGSFTEMTEKRSKFDKSDVPSHSIPTSDLRKILEESADAEHSGDQIDRLVSLADADGDGHVDYDEFVALLKTNESISDIFPCHFS